MASKTEGKAEVIACSWNDTKGQKVNILQQRTVVLLLWRTSIKNLEKRNIKSETFATWKYWKDSRIVRQKILTKNRRI